MQHNTFLGSMYTSTGHIHILIYLLFLYYMYVCSYILHFSALKFPAEEDLAILGGVMVQVFTLVATTVVVQIGPFASLFTSIISSIQSVNK